MSKTRKTSTSPPIRKKRHPPRCRFLRLAGGERSTAAERSSVRKFCEVVAETFVEHRAKTPLKFLKWHRWFQSCLITVPRFAEQFAVPCGGGSGGIAVGGFKILAAGMHLRPSAGNGGAGGNGGHRFRRANTSGACGRGADTGRNILCGGSRHGGCLDGAGNAPRRPRGNEKGGAAALPPVAVEPRCRWRCLSALRHLSSHVSPSA